MIILTITLLGASCSITKTHSRGPASVSGGTGPVEIDVEYKEKAFLALTANEGCHNKDKVMEFIWNRANGACRVHGHNKAISFKVSRIDGPSSWMLRLFSAKSTLDLYTATACHKSVRKVANTKALKGPAGLDLYIEKKFTSYPKKFTYLKCQ